MIELIRPGTTIDFVGKRYLWLGVSLFGILGTFVLFFTKGLNYGIDFTGGAEVQFKVPSDWDISRTRSILEKGGIVVARLQQVGESNSGEYLVRIQGDEKSLQKIGDKVGISLSSSLKPTEFEIQRADVVGPAAGSLLRQRGFFAMIYALLAILAYVAVRFDMRYAPGAVIALFHDTVITVGVFVLTQKQFDLTILAAVLALIGYSNNDTIIVFDRVRETLKLQPNLKIDQAVNLAINETLGRTIMTSLMTFIVTLAIFLFGGSVIENFAFTLMVGIVIGSYSSIFIAGTLVIYFTQRQERHLRGTQLA